MIVQTIFSCCKDSIWWNLVLKIWNVMFSWGLSFLVFAKILTNIEIWTYFSVPFLNTWMSLLIWPQNGIVYSIGYHQLRQCSLLLTESLLLSFMFTWKHDMLADAGNFIKLYWLYFIYLSLTKSQSCYCMGSLMSRWSK